MVNLEKMSRIIDRLEVTSPGPWDTMVDTEGRISVVSPNSEILAENISVEDAWYVSHSREDVEALVHEVLDLRRLVVDIHVLLGDKENHDIIMSYIEAVMKERF